MTKKLWENFFSLSILKGADHLLPLIVMPYLIRILGADQNPKCDLQFWWLMRFYVAD